MTDELFELAIQAMQEHIDAEERLKKISMAQDEAANYTLATLREIAKYRGIKGYSKMNKSQLAEALVA